jgi:tRNA (guanine26-N2/guanine27-N2)-dimethyltransferase
MKPSGIIREGLAEVLPIETNEVFYNPVQVFNRDLSILVVSVFARESRSNSGSLYVKKKKRESGSDEKMSVFEGLAASGLRSVVDNDCIRNSLTVRIAHPSFNSNGL